MGRFYGIVFCAFMILLALLPAACDSDAPALEEQAVYESFFGAMAANRSRPIYLAAATESAWFRDNPFVESAWGDRLDDLGGIPPGLVEELYRVNRESRPIETNPAPAGVEFLPPEFADPPTDAATWRAHCLVDEDQSNIGIRDESGLFFRAYFTVSRVAFSADGTQALMKFSRRCAPMSGGGEFFIAFMRSNAGWEGIGALTLWVS